MDGFHWLGSPTGSAGESQSQSRRSSDGYGGGGAGSGGGTTANNVGTGGGGQQQQQQQGSMNSNLAGGTAMGAAGGYDPFMGMLDFGVGMGGGGLPVGFGSPQANPFGDPFNAAAPSNLYGGSAPGFGVGVGGVASLPYCDGNRASVSSNGVVHCVAGLLSSAHSHVNCVSGMH